MKPVEIIREPLVSVCMITYNHELFIREAIEGVLNQKANFNFELVIGEDAGSDQTRAICEEYQETHPGIVRLLPKEKNKGIMPNFVHSLQQCKGKYIALCEGDDYWTEPTKLQQQVDWLENNDEYVACFHDAVRLIQETGATSAFRDLGNKTAYTIEDIINTDWFIPTHSILFRKTALNLPPWFTKVKNGDFALLLTLGLSGNFYRLPGTWGVYRNHVQGWSQQFAEQRKLTNSILQVLHLFNTQSDFKYAALVESKCMDWLVRLGPHQVFHTYTENRPFLLKILSVDFWLRKGKENIWPGKKMA